MYLYDGTNFFYHRVLFLMSLLFTFGYRTPVLKPGLKLVLASTCPYWYITRMLGHNGLCHHVGLRNCDPCKNEQTGKVEFDSALVQWWVFGTFCARNVYFGNGACLWGVLR